MKYEDKEWIIDRYLAKSQAVNPPDQQPTRAEVERYVDERMRMNKHIIYPAAGDLWNRVEWQRARFVEQYIKQNYPNVIRVELFHRESRLIKKITLEDRTMEVIGYNSKIGEVEKIDVNNADQLMEILTELDTPLNQMSKVKRDTRTLEEKLTAMSRKLRIEVKSD